MNGVGMRCKIQMVIKTETGEAVQEVACFERVMPGIEAVGLTLAEAKTLLLRVQQTLVGQQVADYLERHRNCQDCGKTLLSKGDHPVVFRTLFGNIELKSPQLFRCVCQPHETQSFSPLSEWLDGHTAPERLIWNQMGLADALRHGGQALDRCVALGRAD